jgi:hypothetical protein
MIRPSNEVIALVDALVARLDAETMDEPIKLPGTSSYAVIVASWKRFKATIDSLDSAVADPLGDGAADVLISAEALAGRDVDKLVFWLTHVGEAITRPAALPSRS